MYENFGISKELIELSTKVEKDVEKVFRDIEKISTLLNNPYLFTIISLMFSSGFAAINKLAGTIFSNLYPKGLPAYTQRYPFSDTAAQKKPPVITR